MIYSSYFVLLDFATTAKMYGKIIIAEAFLERQYQTIKPCEIGMLLQFFEIK